MKTKTEQKRAKRVRRHGRVRSKVSGTSARPRLSVFRSNRFIYAQLVDDKTGKTIASSDSRSVSGKNSLEKASTVGADIAELAKKKKITKVTFDRGGFLYTGQVKALADSARDKGLTF